jgi:hypothetical protein
MPKKFFIKVNKTGDITLKNTQTATGGAGGAGGAGGDATNTATLEVDVGAA